MRGADSKRLGESEANKVCGEIFVFRGIDLVNHENHTLAPPRQPFGKLQIQGCGTLLAVDYKKEHIRAFNGDLRGGVGLLRKVGIRAGPNAASIYYLEGRAAKAADRNEAVAGHAWLIMDDGNLATSEAIE
jgi:hypothetical protein